MALKTLISNTKKKVIDVASDVLSAPARISASKKMKQADQDVADLKLDNQTKNVDLTGKDFTDPIFRARANARGLKFDAAKKAKSYEDEYAAKMSPKPKRF